MYSVVVMDMASSVSGSSEAFDVQPAPASSAAGGGQAEAQSVGGGGEVVGDMNLAMLIVACICGENKRLCLKTVVHQSLNCTTGDIYICCCRAEQRHGTELFRFFACEKKQKQEATKKRMCVYGAGATATTIAMCRVRGIKCFFFSRVRFCYSTIAVSFLLSDRCHAC